MAYSILSVGINKYGGGSSLQGCVNDIYGYDAAATMLNYKPKARNLLFDKDASGKMIRKGFDWLVQQSKLVTQTVVFQYSGHGTLLKDKNKDEKDGIDGAIVPADYTTNGFILDDELGLLSDRMPPNSKLIFLLDSCFAGEAQRFSLVGATINMMRKRPFPRFLRVANTPNSTLINYDPATYIDFNTERSVLVATSQPDQTSADAYINGKYQGAGTYALMEAWKDKRRSASYLDIQKVANKWLSANGYQQRIVMAGKAENLWLPFMT